MAGFSTLFTYLIALSSLGLTQATGSPKEDHQQPPPQLNLNFPRPHAFSCPSVLSKLSDGGACPVDEITPLPTIEGFPPWTHYPHCIVSLEKPSLPYCVATNANFHEGRGISIIAFSGHAHDIEQFTDIGRKFSVRAADEVKYEPLEKPGRGIGLFVKKGHSIKAGEVIIVDYPTMTIARDIFDWFEPEERTQMLWMALLQLPEAGREITRSLDKKGRYKDELDNIVTLNALGHSIRETRYMSTFPETARINHNCLPNSYHRFNETTWALEVFALKDIGEGEEITYSYIDPNHAVVFADRHRLLGSQWGFECDCDICKSPSKRKESDKRRTEITRIRALLSENSKGEDIDLLIEGTEKLLELYNEEGMIVPRAMAAEVAAYSYNQNGEADDAVKYAEISRDMWRVIAGENSNEVKRLDELIKEPKLHGSWKPKSDAGDVLDEERAAEGSAEKSSGGIDEDVVMEAVRAAMAKAKKVAREEGVSEETEEVLIQEAVKAALKNIKGGAATEEKVAAPEGDGEKVAPPGKDEL